MESQNDDITSFWATVLLLLTLKRQEFLHIFLKTAFYGLETEPEQGPETEP
jgi:hypothetical protein